VRKEYCTSSVGGGGGGVPFIVCPDVLTVWGILRPPLILARS
jgi:hypothetical protein